MTMDRNNFITSLKDAKPQAANTQRFQQGSLFGLTASNNGLNNQNTLAATENLETENSNLESERHQVCQALRVNHDSNLSMSHRSKQYNSFVVGTSPLTSARKAGPPSQLSQLLLSQKPQGKSHSTVTSPQALK